MAKKTRRAERLAVSFPLVVAVLGFIGWMVQSLISSQSNQSRRSR